MMRFLGVALTAPKVPLDQGNGNWDPPPVTGMRQEVDIRYIVTSLKV